MKEIEISRIQELPIITGGKVGLFIKREDELHPFVSGNKFRKLKFWWSLF
jgi:1-aminocyclopropane-1-carboxylate deaminase/D-cysteine desulfhydrase-like pyridoxal-dependent ACC family enzyme